VPWENQKGTEKVETEPMLVNEQNLIDDLSAMVRIPSLNSFGHPDPQNPAEEAMAQFFEARLKELDLDVSTAVVADGRRNVWGRLKGSGGGPTLMLAGHMDTVGVAGYAEPFEPTFQDGCIHGRGSCDMKAGLAAYLEVARIILARDLPLKGDLIIAGVVDEEDAMIGSKHFGEKGPKVDYAIVAEPSKLAISTAHRGQVCLTIRTLGVSTHSSVPQNGINAIYHMSAAIQALQDYANQLTTRDADPLCGKPTFSVGAIKGGENASSVPDFCEIEVDRRTVPGESYESILAELNEILTGVAANIPDFKYEISSPALYCPPLKTDMASPIVGAISSAVKSALGQDPTYMTFPGSTDAPNFGCPTVICGAGDLAQCHSINEYVPVAEIKAAIEIYLATIDLMQNQPAPK
jgi:acetylornithine deacetylase/succinyl-diaminopimelate desuccinylase family protein